MWGGQPGYLPGEGPAGACWRVADEPAYRQPDHHRCPGQRPIVQHSLVAAMHPRGGHTAAGTLGRRDGGLGVDHDPARIPSYLFKGHVFQVREEKLETAPDLATRVHIGHTADTPTATRSSPEPMFVAGDSRWKATSLAALYGSRWGAPRGRRAVACTQTSKGEIREGRWSARLGDHQAGRLGNAEAVSPR